MNKTIWSHKKGRIFLIIFSLAAGIYGLSAVNWSLRNFFLTPDQQGRVLMARKDFSGAAQVFVSPLWRGVALYRNGDFKEAAAAFGQEASTDALYNRANALLMYGKYEIAIAAYEQVLSQQPDWRAAQENLALAKARMEKMKPPEDDAGGTGGMLGADDVVFGKRGENNSSDQQEEVEGGSTDLELQAMWLRRIEVRPADFLRAKFAFQAHQKRSGQ